MTSIVLAWLPSQQWKEQGPGSLPANQPRVSLWQCSVIKPWSSAASKVESDLTLTSSHQVLTLSKMMTTCTCLPTFSEIWDLEWTSLIWRDGGIIHSNSNEHKPKPPKIKDNDNNNSGSFPPSPSLSRPRLSLSGQQPNPPGEYLCLLSKQICVAKWKRERGSKWWILYILRHVWK